VQNYGSGVQACYRGPRLYDTDATKSLVTREIAHYNKYRDILNSDIIHLRRPDGRSWDGFMHVNTYLNEKGFILLFNPTQKPIRDKVGIPLYYTGIVNKALLSEKGRNPKEYVLNRNFEIEINISIPPNGYTWFVIQ